jgi:hypothetical protein
MATAAEATTVAVVTLLSDAVLWRGKNMSTSTPINVKQNTMCKQTNSKCEGTLNVQKTSSSLFLLHIHNLAVDMSHHTMSCNGRGNNGREYTTMMADNYEQVK